MPERPAPTISTSKCSFCVVISMGHPNLPPSWPGIVPAIHVCAQMDSKDVDARHRRQVYAVCAQTAMAGHDEKLALPTGATVIPGREQRERTRNLEIPGSR